MRPVRLALFVIAAVVCAQPAFAERGITPYYGYNYGGDSSNCVSLRDCKERHSNFGVSIGSVGGPGMEIDFAYAKNFFGEAPGSDNSVLTLMSNLLLGVPLGPIHPFVLGGVGLIRPHASLDVSDLATSKNAVGYDLGFGVSLSLGRRLAIRGDIRRFNTFDDVKLFVFSGGHLSFSRASIGLTIK